MTKENKVSIYDLFEREKIVELSDGEKKFSLLLVKMTIKERSNAMIVLNSKHIEIIDRINHTNTIEVTMIKEQINKADKSVLVESILDQEEVEEFQDIDKYNIPDKDNLNEAEIKERQDENIKKWREKRKENVEKNYDVNQLREEFLNFKIKYIAYTEAWREYNIECLVYMCRDPKTKKQIFKTRDDVKKLPDIRTLEQLLKELNDFRKFETEREVREGAQDSDFFQSGGSEKK